MVTAKRQLNRREALMGTALVGTGALATLISGCGTSSANTGTSAAAGLEGAWREDISLDNGQTHQALILCTKDGGVAVSATLSPNSFGNGLGAWIRTGNQYLLTFEAFVITSGAFDFRLRVRATPTIDQSGDQMTATVKFDVQPAGASSFTSGGSGSWTGSRIKPVAL